MMNLPDRLLLLVISVLISVSLYGQFPAFEKFLSEMHLRIPEDPEGGYFELSKKPDGWYVNLLTYDTDAQIPILVASAKGWDVETQRFLTPEFHTAFPFLPARDLAPEDRFQVLWMRRASTEYFPYYGYAEWITDSKKYLESLPHPTSGQLESLARVYAAEATNFIHPAQYGLNGALGSWYPDADYGKLDAERVKGFVRAYDRAMEIWEQIRKTDPAYIPGIIGDLDLKIGNEYMYGYLVMLSIREPELAMKYLNKTTFPSNVLSYARTLLEECAPGAILLTNGDSDTFPLWYLQKKENLRKDVLIVNQSLIMTSWYAEMLVDLNAAKVSMTSDEIRENRNRFFVMGEEDRLGFPEWMEMYRGLKYAANPRIEMTDNYVLTGCRWNLPVGSDTVQVRSNKYVYGSVLFMYDLICSNPNRPVQSVSYVGLNDLGLQDNTTDWGFTYHLEHVRPENIKPDGSDGFILQQLNQFPDDFFTVKNPWASNTQTMLLSIIQRISPDRRTEVLQLLDQKIVPKIPLEEMKPAFASELAVCYEYFDPPGKELFLTQYEPTAIGIIKSYVLNAEQVYSDLEELESLVGAYTGLQFWQLRRYPDQQSSWLGSLALKQELAAKINQMVVFCERENLLWSLSFARRLKTVLERSESDYRHEH